MATEDKGFLCKQALIDFFGQFTHKNITGATAINNDLLLMRSEVPMIVDFLRHQMKVRINVSDVEEYFLGEFTIPLQYTYFKIFKPSKLYKPILTIDHLVSVCKLGYWFDPPSLK